MFNYLLDPIGIQRVPEFQCHQITPAADPNTDHLTEQ
jgi:hypothetical protein